MNSTNTLPGTGDSFDDIIHPKVSPFQGQVIDWQEVDRIKRETPEETLTKLLKEQGLKKLK